MIFNNIIDVLLVFIFHYEYIIFTFLIEMAINETQFLNRR